METKVVSKPKNLSYRVIPYKRKRKHIPTALRDCQFQYEASDKFESLSKFAIKHYINVMWWIIDRGQKCRFEIAQWLEMCVEKSFLIDGRDNYPIAKFMLQTYHILKPKTLKTLYTFFWSRRCGSGEFYCIEETEWDEMYRHLKEKLPEHEFIPNRGTETRTPRWILEDRTELSSLYYVVHGIRKPLVYDFSFVMANRLRDCSSREYRSLWRSVEKTKRYSTLENLLKEQPIWSVLCYEMAIDLHLYPLFVQHDLTDAEFFVRLYMISKNPHKAIDTGCFFNEHRSQVKYLWMRFQEEKKHKKDAVYSELYCNPKGFELPIEILDVIMQYSFDY